MSAKEPRTGGGPRPYFLISRIRSAINDVMAREFRSVGLTPALGEVLHAIALEGKGSSSDVARRLGITPQSIMQSVQTLERLGYVKRRRSPDDQRAQIVSLTASGEKARLFCLSVLDHMYPEIFGVLEPAEMKQLNKLLTKVVAATDPETLEVYVDRRSRPR